MVDLPTHYDTGTATITNASTTVTGQGTSWLSAITVGDILIGKFGEIGIVSAVGSNTSITLSRAWQGTSQTTDDYEIWFTPDATRMQETTRQVLEYLANGYLEAISGLTPTDGNIIVGDGATWVAESGATARTSLGVGTGDSPQLTGIELGHATDTTLTRASAGVVAIEGTNIIKGSTGSTDNRLLRADGTGTVTAQNSAITVDDSGNTSGMGTLAVGAITTSGLLTTSNGQIAMPASQNASAGANTWDDYEEGTSTPTVVGSGTAGAGTYSEQLSKYNKSGSKVSSTIALTWSAHTGAGNTLIGGQPFTSVASYSWMYSTLLSSHTFTGTNVTTSVNPGATTINVLQYSSAAAASLIELDTSASIYATGHYGASA